MGDETGINHLTDRGARMSRRRWRTSCVIGRLPHRQAFPGAALTGRVAFFARAIRRTGLLFEICAGRDADPWRTTDRMSGDTHRLLGTRPVERLSRDALRALQLAAPQATGRRTITPAPNSIAPSSLRPGCSPATSDRLRISARLPLMTKDEHRRAQAESLERYGDPLRLLNCAPIDKVVRINSTSGTTGMPTLYALTAQDVAVVNEMHARKYWRAGIRPGHIMLQALSLSMFTGGLPLSQGIQHMGACVVPVGMEGGTGVCSSILRCCIRRRSSRRPRSGMYLIEEAPKLIGKPAPRTRACNGSSAPAKPGGGNAGGAQGFGGRFRRARIFDHTGGGHAFHGISRDEPPEQYSGMYFVSEDHCLLEIVDPRSKAADRP